MHLTQGTTPRAPQAAVVNNVGLSKGCYPDGHVQQIKTRPFDPSDFYAKPRQSLDFKSVNLKYITVGRLNDDMIVPPSDGAMFILMDWE